MQAGCSPEDLSSTIVGPSSSEKIYLSWPYRGVATSMIVRLK